MKTTVPVAIPLHVIVPQAKHLAQQIRGCLEWVGVDGMGCQYIGVNPVMLKAVSGIFCLVTLAGYAWVKGWGSYFYERIKPPRRDGSEDSSKALFNVDPKADIVDPCGLKSLNDKLLELTGKLLCTAFI